MGKGLQPRLGAVAAVLRGRTRRARGQGLVEYALILGFVAVLVLVALHFLQPAVSTSLNNVANSF